MSAESKKQDVFERAGFLIGNGHVLPGDRADALRCKSQSFPEEKIYNVTFDGCDCYIGLYRKRKICKHRLSCFAAPVVLMVLEIRDIKTQGYLETIGKEYAEAISDLDESFIAMARLEYRKKLEEIRSREEAAA